MKGHSGREPRGNFKNIPSTQRSDHSKITNKTRRENSQAYLTEQELIAVLREPNADILESVAEAIYATHQRAPSPVWKNASNNVQQWVRAQARSALACLRDLIDRANV